MLILRETFTCRPGMASRLAKLFREMGNAVPGAKSRVLTDYMGRFNTVVWEVELASLGDFEAMMKEYESKPDLRAKMAGYTDMYVSGKREVFRVVE